jgi:sugar/nucleoside kinase (ribokinase family)
LWSSDVLYVSRVGPDFSDYFGEWLQNNRVSSGGLIFSLPRTHYSTLKYRGQGEYEETSKHGKEHEEFVYPLSRLQSSDIARFCSSATKGIYLEANEDESIWNNLGEIRNMTDAKILWEVPTDAVSDVRRRAETLDKVNLVDAFSVNISEGEMLMQTKDRSILLERFQSLSVPCFLRAGKEGAYWISDTGIFFASSILIGPAVDPTGCGNASTAGALFAFAEGFSPERIPVMANISAAFTILQVGPYPQIGEAERRLARELLNNC